MMRWPALLLLLLVLAPERNLSALETVRGVVRALTEVQCLNDCGRYYIQPDSTYEQTIVKADLRAYLGLHVQLIGFRDNCSGCLVLVPLGSVILLPPLTAAEEEPILIPREVRLMQNYPNPFNPSTVIEYALSSASTVRLAVYNLLGEQVGLLVDAQEPPGVYQKSWSPGDLSGGVYFYQLRVASATVNRSITRSMILAR